jgi:hypothetical protein
MHKTIFHRALCNGNHKSIACLPQAGSLIPTKSVGTSKRLRDGAREVSLNLTCSYESSSLPERRGTAVPKGFLWKKRETRNVTPLDLQLRRKIMFLHHQ